MSRNKILPLFNQQFVLDLFRREILPHYPEFSSISHLNIKPYKELVWETTYHVVIGFETYFVKKDGSETKILIVCSAHSGEPRENVYSALKYLWSVDFPNEFISLPEPLFYSSEFRGTFYRGLAGENLLYYIQHKEFSIVEEVIVNSAKLFARLHSLGNLQQVNFNPESSRIQTVIPGVEAIYQKMKRHYHGKYNDDLVKIYSYFLDEEEKYFSSNSSLVLIHGDAHPENIIYISPQHLGLIDFTDLCLGDRARDLGTFIQQLKYKFVASDQERAQNMVNLFLSTYLKTLGLKLSPELQARINLYYNWTAVRTAIYWFLKSDREEERAQILLAQVKRNLKL